jgi:hypothetical protein
LFALNSSALLRAAGGKAFAAQHGSSARRLEGHAVGLAALIAGNFETLAVAAACASSASAEIGASAIATSLATLRLAQVSLSVIFLFAFCERKRRAALCASDLYVWHFQLLPTESRCEVLQLSLFRRRAWRSSFSKPLLTLTVIERGRPISFRSRNAPAQHHTHRNLLSNPEFTPRLSQCTEIIIRTNFY